MDFFKVRVNMKKDKAEVYPDFKVVRSKDLMIRGGDFYAVWDEERHIWSTDSYDIQRLVDKELWDYRNRMFEPDANVIVKTLENFTSNSWTQFKSYVKALEDNSHQLDTKVMFKNDLIKKEDYASRQLPYSLLEGSTDAYDKMMSVLYTEEERNKIEWAIGCVLAGETKYVEKFLVFYGEGGTGKSTVLNIIQKLFAGYYAIFDSKALVSKNNTFAAEVFKTNPLVALQHDGDLSRVEDNALLNSLVSHEEILINEKYKSAYKSKPNCFIFMGSNKTVKITDAKSGLLRRLIEVNPTGNRIPAKRYNILKNQIDFELGAIAYKCLEKYKHMGKHYYDDYRPLSMFMKTNDFYNFMESEYFFFKERNGVKLKQAYAVYKTYCAEANVLYPLPLRDFREELKNYFKTFHNITRIDGKQVRSYYECFMVSKFAMEYNTNDEVEEVVEEVCGLSLDEDKSLLDDVLQDCPAQYASMKFETPVKKWDTVTKTLKDIDTTKLHYVKPPINHIMIDFDLKDENGKKCLALNIEAAKDWPSTYAELSKGGEGLHLHYNYDGDPYELDNVYSPGIEIKVFNGNSSLRRRLSKCNDIPIATINNGLPLKTKGVNKVIDFKTVQNEKNLRKLIEKNLKKEIHPGTKPSIDFIYKILEDSYKSSLIYDLTDMRPAILTFASKSTNQSDYCIKLVSQMKFMSSDKDIIVTEESQPSDKDLVFFDCEVFKNLFVVVWKRTGKAPVRMINPSSDEIESLLKFNLVGFNCRKYDNHILYARYIGYSNERLYTLSQRIINNSENATFREAYNISYTDVYDFASAQNKKSLKKWEIELGIHHLELGIPWDQEVPEELWEKVADYCCNDVDATEAVFYHLSGDWAARQILAELSGLSLNDTTNQHSTRIVFGTDKNTQDKLVYTDLSEMFPGYKYEFGKSTYKGEVVGEGGYVYAEPGIYKDVALLDVASMHPTSIEQLNLFGPYTKKYSDLKKGRICIKNKDHDGLKELLDGKLIPFVEEAMSENPRFTMRDVSNGLKTALNSAYGLTSAKFDNPFRDIRNIDNIVAKRGALFMIDLKEAVQAKGYIVAHIKTDSIKIPNADKEIIDFVIEFGKKYGYDFEHEADYSKMCLVNDAVYIARYAYKEKDPWVAVGAQFQHPYVFKSMFSQDPIEFKDMCETKSVTTSMYLDMSSDNAPERDYHFVGKVGSFAPIKPGKGGGVLLREKEGKYYAVGGTKGYRWLEAEVVKTLGKEDDIDYDYFGELITKAHETIGKFGDVGNFITTSAEELDAIPF